MYLKFFVLLMQRVDVDEGRRTFCERGEEGERGAGGREKREGGGGGILKGNIHNIIQ